MKGRKDKRKEGRRGGRREGRRKEETHSLSWEEGISIFFLSPNLEKKYTHSKGVKKSRATSALLPSGRTEKGERKREYGKRRTEGRRGSGRRKVKGKEGRKDRKKEREKVERRDRRKGQKEGAKEGDRVYAHTFRNTSLAWSYSVRNITSVKLNAARDFSLVRSDSVRNVSLLV
jgi:hypothetical protein